jgi:thiol-disulfide isomerase/thioredoxin
MVLRALSFCGMFSAFALCFAFGGSSAKANAAGGATTLDPIFRLAGGWLNGRAEPNALQGKVVVLDVFTFDCINCKHVVPNLKALHRRYPDNVAIVGIHAPETSYERERANVASNLARQGIVWPVAIDNAFALWKAYGVDAWPTQLVFDRRGRLRKTIVGEGFDADLDAEIARLVAER